MAIGDLYKLSCIWNRSPSEQVIVNEFVFRQDTALILDTPEEDLVQAFTNEVQDLYVALVTDFLSLITYRVALLPANDASLIQSVGVAGGSTGDPLPSYTSQFVRARTANFTRSGRGGFYLPPTVESANTNGVPNSGYTTPIGTMCDALIDDMSTADLAHGAWSWVVYSRLTETFNVITNVTIPPRWSHQIDRRGAY